MDAQVFHQRCCALPAGRVVLMRGIGVCVGVCVGVWRCARPCVKTRTPVDQITNAYMPSHGNMARRCPDRKHTGTTFLSFPYIHAQARLHRRRHQDAEPARVVQCHSVTPLFISHPFSLHLSCWVSSQFFCAVWLIHVAFGHFIWCLCVWMWIWMWMGTWAWQAGQGQA